MKTTYRSKNNKGRRKNFVTVVIVVAVLAVVIFTGLISKTFYKGMVFLSFGKASSTQTVSSFFDLFSSKHTLIKENQDLTSQLNILKMSVSDREALVKENGDLKASLHLRQDTQNKIGATVLSKPPFTPFDIIVINTGEKAGVKVGSRVMLGQTYLGTIIKVSDYTSEVQLLSSSLVKTDVFIGDKALPAVLSGKGGGNFEVSLPQGSDVKEQDLVFATLHNEVLFIGTVAHIIENSDNTLMTLLIAFPFSLYELSYVEVISS